MRIALVTLCLNAGGAERLATQMANHWAAAGHDVSIVLMVNLRDWPAFYRLDPRVHVVDLDVYGDSRGPWQAARMNWVRFSQLRRTLRRVRPDVVVSQQERENALTVLATRGMGIPVIATVHSDPSLGDPSRAWTALERLTYGLADAVIVQTPQARDFYSARIRRRVRVLPNPVTPPPAANGAAPASPRRPVVLTVGGLRPVKNQALLIRAFARVAPRHPDWTLVIVGEGPSRAQLETLAAAQGVGARVQFPGWVSDVYSLYRRADLFVLSSLREGWGMVLCEAMSCGLPVISTRCPTGPEHIVRDGIDGRLVRNEDEPALAQAMGELMADPAARQRLARRAPEVLDRFSSQRIMGEWQVLLDQLTHRSQPAPEVPQ